MTGLVAGIYVAHCRRYGLIGSLDYEDGAYFDATQLTTTTKAIGATLGLDVHRVPWLELKIRGKCPATSNMVEKRH